MHVLGNVKNIVIALNIYITPWGNVVLKLPMILQRTSFAALERTARVKLLVSFFFGFLLCIGSCTHEPIETFEAIERFS
jgi:hypothetical protein